MGLDDAEVSLFLSGSWKGRFLLTGSLAFPDAGPRPFFAPPLLEQEADLTLELTLDDRWFVAASFLDDYALNGYRAGYRGKEGETVRYVGFGNSGLDFPRFPYLDLGGDAPNSFGAYGRFGFGDLSVHAVARYDAAVRAEKTFRGTRELSVIDVPIADRLRGRAFVLPDSGLDAAPEVYLEDKDGPLLGSDGRKYRRAAPAEHGASAAEGLVELTGEPAARVAVAYAKGGDREPWKASLGAYAGGGFLGEAGLALAGAGIDLAALPQSGGGDGEPAAVLIGGVPALVVYEKGTFSPFEVQALYRGGRGAEAALARRSTGSAEPGFELLAPGAAADGSGGGPAAARESGAWTLVRSGTPVSPRTPGRRWPLGPEAPAAYVGGRTDGDLVVRFRELGPPGAFAVGKDAVPGSVAVTRNGVPDPSAAYDAESGEVVLEVPAAENETIRISYLKRADERRFGSFAAGVGATWDPLGPLSGKLALGFRWTASPAAFSEYGSPNPGTAGLGGSLSWEEENLKASLRAGFSYSQDDATGLYRVAGMEGSEVRLEAAASAAFPSEPPISFDPALTAANRAPLPYRDYRAADDQGNIVLKSIDWPNAPLVEGKEGPYPVSDPGWGGAVLVAEFGLDAASPWTGFQVRLPEGVSALARAKSLLVPLRFHGASAPEGDFEVWIQTGALADPKTGRTESPALAWRALLYSYRAGVDPLPPTTWEAGSRRLDLTDDDRAKLADAASFRVLVRRTGGAGPAEGRLLLGSPVAAGAAFLPSTSTPLDGARPAPDRPHRGVAAVEAADGALAAAFPADISRLHPDKAVQRVLAVAWEGLDEGMGAGAENRIDSVPLRSYRSISLFVRGPSGGAPSAFADAVLRVVLGASGSDAAEGRRPELDVRVPASAFRPGAWSRLSVDYRSSTATVDGVRVDGASIAFSPREDAEGPTWIGLHLLPPEGAVLPDGSFSADEIVLEGSLPAYGADAAGNVSYVRPGPLLVLGGATVLSDTALSASFSTSARGDPLGGEAGRAASLFAGGAGKASATLLGSRLEAGIEASAGPAGAVWAASHDAKIPLGPLRLEEGFSMAPADASFERKLGLGAFGLKAEAKAANGPLALERTWKAAFAAAGELRGAAARDEGNDPTVNRAPVRLSAAADLDLAWTEARRAAVEANYAASWAAASALLMPDEGRDARRRSSAAGIRLSAEGAPLGAVLGGRASALYAAASGRVDSRSQASFDLPFSAGDSTGGLGLRREFSISRPTANGGALTDAAEWASALADAAEPCSAAPLRSFFDPALRETFEAATRGAASASFRDGISLETAFPAMPGPAALAVPAAASVETYRLLERRQDTVADSVVASGKFSFAATNLFGSFGSAPVFGFYRTDDFAHSVSVRVAFGQAGIDEWRATAKQDASFFGDADARLKLSNALSFGSRGWAEGANLEWIHPAPGSPIEALFRAAVDPARELGASPALRALARGEAVAERIERLDVSYSAEGKSPSWKVAAAHVAQVRVPGKATFSAFAELEASAPPDAPPTLSGKAGVSLALRF